MMYAYSIYSGMSMIPSGLLLTEDFKGHAPSIDADVALVYIGKFDDEDRAVREWQRIFANLLLAQFHYIQRVADDIAEGHSKLAVFKVYGPGAKVITPWHSDREEVEMSVRAETQRERRHRAYERFTS